MTIWTPVLADSGVPIYLRVADALERDVRAGTLVAGSRLPTHRDLARELGVTPVTVTRAYAEAAKRGLVEASTGRGTFVRAVRREAAMSADIDLATNVINIPLPAPCRSCAARRRRSMRTTRSVPAANGTAPPARHGSDGAPIRRR
jgi:DNA-binding transcriptional regulator YhcF (GntR family)